MPIPPPLRRNDHSGIDRSVCGRTASCAFAANNQFYLPFRHFPIGEINSLFLRKFAYVLSIVGGIFPRIFHCREAGEKWRKRNHFIRRESKGKNRGGGRERERQLGGNSQGGSISFPFVFTSPREVENCCRRGRWTRDTSIFPPLLARDSLAFREEEESRWRNDGRSGGEFFGFSRRKKERKWCLWRNVFVKDSLTRSSLPEYYFTWRGFTNLGQRRPPSSSSSFVRLDYATTLFPCLSFLAFLFFPFPFPLSFLSLSRNSPHSYSLLLCPG